MSGGSLHLPLCSTLNRIMTVPLLLLLLHHHPPIIPPELQHLAWEEVMRAALGPVYSGRKTRLTTDKESQCVSACRHQGKLSGCVTAVQGKLRLLLSVHTELVQVGIVS